MKKKFIIKNVTTDRYYNCSGIVWREKVQSATEFNTKKEAESKTAKRNVK